MKIIREFFLVRRALVVVAFFLSMSASAQVLTPITPANGLTIKTVVALPYGNVAVVLNEALSVTCPSWSWSGSPNFASPLWLELTSTNLPSAKQMYATVLSASLTGKKLSTIWIYQAAAGQSCYLVGVTVDS